MSELYDSELYEKFSSLEFELNMNYPEIDAEDLLRQLEKLIKNHFKE